MTVNILDWYPEINPDIQNLPLAALIEAVRASAIRFCEKTHLWAVNLDRISVVDSTSDYTLTIDSALYAELVEVQNVKFKKDGESDDAFQRVNPVSEVQADNDRAAGWKSYSASSDSKYEYLIDPVNKTTLTLIPTPDEDSTEGLLVKAVLKPLRTTTVLPDFLYNDHREAIGFGAKANLYLRKSMIWYDPELAGHFERRFQAKCGDGKWEKVKGKAQTGMPHQIKMRPMV